MINSSSSTMSLTKNFITTPSTQSPYDNASGTAQTNESRNDYNYRSPVYTSNSTSSSPIFGKASISTVGGSPASAGPPTTSVSQENVFSTTDGDSTTHINSIIHNNGNSTNDAKNATANSNGPAGANNNDHNDSTKNGDTTQSISHPAISIVSPNSDDRHGVPIGNNSGLVTKEVPVGNAGDSLAVTSPQNIAKIRKDSIAHSQGIGGVSWGSLTIGSWLRDEVMFNSMLKQQNYNGSNNGTGKDGSSNLTNGSNVGTNTISYRRLSTINNYNIHGGRNSTSTAAGKLGFPASPPGYAQSAYISNLEQQYCKDYSCCGLSLPSLHDLLRHYEEAHINTNTNHPMGLDHMLTPVTDDNSSTANSTTDNGFNFSGGNNSNNNNNINPGHQSGGDNVNASSASASGVNGNSGINSDIKTPLVNLKSRFGNGSTMEDFGFRSIDDAHVDDIMMRGDELDGGGDAAIDPISKYAGHNQGIGGMGGADTAISRHIHGVGTGASTSSGHDISSAPSLLLNNALMGSTNMFMIQDNDERLGGDSTFQFRQNRIGGNGLMDSIPNYTTTNKFGTDSGDVGMGVNDLVISSSGVNGTDHMELDFMDDDILGNVGGINTVEGINKNSLSGGDQPSQLPLGTHSQQFQQPPSILSSPSSASQAAQNSPRIVLGHQDVSTMGNTTPIIVGAPHNDHEHGENGVSGTNSTVLSTPLTVNPTTDKFMLNLDQNFVHFGYGTAAANVTNGGTASGSLMGNVSAAARGLNFQLNGIGIISNINAGNASNNGGGTGVTDEGNLYGVGATIHTDITGINGINAGGNNILVNPSVSPLQSGNKAGGINNSADNPLLKSSAGASRFKGKQSHINKMAQDGYIDDPARKLYVIDREEHKPFKCPVIGCEKTYKNQNGLKYHKLHGHQNQKLHENPDGTFSIIDPYSNEPYPDGMAYEKDKPYRCEVCGKRYKNLNGLKYHRGHTTH